MKHITDEQLEQDLTVFATMKEVSSPNFFYTRLKARMEKESKSNEVVLSIKPVLVICALSLFLIINSLLLKKGTTLANTTTSEAIEVFAASYDQTISN